MMQKGTLIQEKKYYDGKIDRLKELIDDNYRKIEIKSLQKTK